MTEVMSSNSLNSLNNMNDCSNSKDNFEDKFENSKSESSSQIPYSQNMTLQRTKQKGDTLFPLHMEDQKFAVVGVATTHRTTTKAISPTIVVYGCFGSDNEVQEYLDDSEPQMTYIKVNCVEEFYIGNDLDITIEVL